jgi:acetyltransferase-like isoleucine patch superfamily enzyme
VKQRRHPAARFIYAVGAGVRRLHVPYIGVIHAPLYLVHRGVRNFVNEALRIGWYTPLFQSRLVRPASGLRVWGGLPLIMGDLLIEIGRNCVLSGQSVFTGRAAGGQVPSLVIGDNTEIGYANQFAVGRKIVIGANVLTASNCFFAGYPGHPLDPEARARHEPDTEDQIGDIVIGDNVWLATGVTVLAGVTIGRNTIVGVGSVVTRDLPANVIAAGAPARVVKTLEEAGMEPGGRDTLRGHAPSSAK